MFLHCQISPTPWLPKTSLKVTSEIQYSVRGEAAVPAPTVGGGRNTGWKCPLTSWSPFVIDLKLPMTWASDGDTMSSAARYVRPRTWDSRFIYVSAFFGANGKQECPGA